MGVDQTHESWVVGGQVVVKWMTEPLVGPHPARDRLRRLAAAGFAESPALWGLVEWREPDTDALGPGRRRAVLPARHRGRLDLGGHRGAPGAARRARPGPGLRRRPRRRRRADAPGARRRPAGAADAGAGAAARRRGARRPRPGRSARPSRTTRTPTRCWCEHRPRIEEVLGGLAEAAGAVVLPVHGDLHVGQVLRGPAGYAVVDFDGNPTRTPALRAEDAPGGDGRRRHAGQPGERQPRRPARCRGPPTPTPRRRPSTGPPWPGPAMRRGCSSAATGAPSATGRTCSTRPWCRRTPGSRSAGRSSTPPSTTCLEWLYVPAASLRRRLVEHLMEPDLFLADLAEKPARLAGLAQRLRDGTLGGAR